MINLIQDLGTKLPSPSATRKRRYGIYECAHCAEPFETRTDGVKNGSTINCPACKNITHGLSSHPLYNTWRHEKKRCYLTSSKDYINYGARGITVSAEFHNFAVWLAYIVALPNYLKDNYTIDRIDNNGNYERGNMQWVDKSTQSQNSQKLRSTNTSGYRGVYKQGKKWRASIWINNKQIILGMFECKVDGAIAYDKYVLANKLAHTINGVMNE